MVYVRGTVLCILVTASWALNQNFPANFKFGASSAAYQVEGAWNVSDKSESIWDRFTHTRPIADNSTGDVACSSYFLYKEDVKLAKQLGLNFYRFSISWTRILPTGYSNIISKDGKQYYNNLINELLKNGIEPVVTMYHWDLPQRFQDLGGWTNPLVADWFMDYAKVLFTLYGDRVKTWITLNEPIAFCDIAYNSGVFAPGIVDPDNAGYICNKNALIAHAKAWRMFDQEFRPKFGGQVSLTNYVVWCEGETKNDTKLAELVNDYEFGRYSHPIYSKEGGWPKELEQIIARNSQSEGLPRSRLPKFTQKEIDLIKGTSDFYALNYYTSSVARKARPGEKLMYGINGDVPELNAKVGPRPNWPVNTAFEDFAIYPLGLRLAMNWLRSKYGNLGFLIAENGYPTLDPGLDDGARSQYLKDHMKQILLTIKEDHINVTGYSVWSLIDNFEWSKGYTVKFGLHKVDFKDPKRKRTPRKSAEFFRKVIRSRSLN